jgi:hypothetical protein
MKITTRTTARLSATLLLASAVSACDVPPEATGASEPDATTSVVAKTRPGTKTLVHSEEIGPGHKVEFYRLASGMTGYLETGSIDDKMILREAKDMDSLAKVFSRVAPTRAVPKAIIDADRTAQELELGMARQIAEVGPPPAPEAIAAPSPAASTAIMSEPDDITARQSSALTLLICSADVLGDNWGKDWWLNNFCKTTLAHRECDANRGSLNANWRIKHWNYTVFEGDFNEKGHTTASTRWCTWNIFYGWDCYWIADFDFDVNPRKVAVAGYTSKDGAWVNANSKSPCGHLGFVVGWD